MTENLTAEPAPTKKKKRFKRHGSIMYRTWLYFVGMTLVMLALLWGTEVILFKAYYVRMKEHEVEVECAELFASFSADKYDAETETLSDDYVKEIEAAVSGNQLLLVMFTVTPDVDLGAVTPADINIVIYRDHFGRTPSESLGPNMPSFMPEPTYFTERDSGEFTYRVRHDNGAYTVVVGNSTKLPDGTEMWFYASSVVMPMDATISLLASQLVLVTCLCIAVSILLSYALSKRFTRPIREYAATARKLGKEKVEFRPTDLKEFDELAKALNYSAEELEKTEKMRRDFLANVSHDLRTPLTMVKAYAEMVRDISWRDEKKRNEHCKVIIDEVDRLTLLVNDILDLSKIQSGTREPEKKRVDLSSLAGTVLERFQILTEQSGYKFDLSADADCFVTADERMVEQIIYNLIGNAVSYTGEDKKVGVRVKRLENAVRVEISDSGKGIAPSERDKVWDRYYRSSQAKRAIVGSGIGLSICKNLLVLHGAEYGIDSVVNNGSTFWFVMPYAPETDEKSR